MPRPKTISDEDLLKACRAEFIDRGLQVSTKRLAQRAGISEGILFQRFGTKDELFFASMRMPPPRLEDASSKALASPLIDAALLIFATAVLEYLRRNMPAVLLVLAHPQYRSQPESISHRSHEFLLNAQSMHGGFDAIFEQFGCSGGVSRKDHQHLSEVLIATLLARAMHEQIGVNHPGDRKRWLTRVIKTLELGYAGG